MMRKVTRLLAATLAVTTFAAASPPKSPELPKSAPAPSGPVVSPAPTAPGAVPVGVHPLDANDLKAWLDGKELTLPPSTGDQPRTVAVRLTKGDHELILRVPGGTKAGLVTTFVAAKPLEFR